MSNIVRANFRKRRGPAINYSVDAEVIPLEQNTFEPNQQDIELARGNEEFFDESEYQVSDKVRKIAQFMSELEMWKTKYNVQLNRDENEDLFNQYYRIEKDIETLAFKVLTSEEILQVASMENSAEQSLNEVKEERI